MMFTIKNEKNFLLIFSSKIFSIFDNLLMKID